MRKFKVGDRVRIVHEEYGHEFDIGEEVEILEVTPDDYYAKGADEKWWILDNEAELIGKPRPFIIGQTYQTAERGEVTCIALREDGGMFATGAGDDTAYSWNADGSYRNALPPNCPPYLILFAPVRETVTNMFTFWAGDGCRAENINVTLDMVDGKPDWTSAKVAPC